MSFQFTTPGQIVVGKGCHTGAIEYARAYGSRVLVITGKVPSRTEHIRHWMRERGFTVSEFAVPHEPTLDVVSQGVTEARGNDCQCVLAIGGGSVIDTGKAVAALVTNRRPVIDYLEVIGAGMPLENPSLPLIAVPTTAGSGAEATRNAVLTSPEHKVKVSLRHPSMLPKIAIIDSTLTFDLPPALVAATGMDALSQLIEPFVSSSANPITDAICRDGLDLIGRSFRAAYRRSSYDSRDDMSLASLFGGLALANSGLGAVHGFAAPFGAMFNAPHGAVCAALLAPVMRVNARHYGAERFDEVARRLTRKPTARAADGIGWVETLVKEMNIPGLTSYGLRAEHFADLIAKAKNASSMRANPVTLTDTELAEILYSAS